MAEEDPFASDEFNTLLDNFIAAQLKDVEDDAIDDDSHQSSQESAQQLSTEQVELPNDYSLPFAEEESRLYRAFTEFLQSAVACGTEANVEIPEFHFQGEELLPRFRPSQTENLINDINAGWGILIAAQPVRLKSLPDNPSDDQILNFAEKVTDKNFQMALISYVETLIEIESCEIAYNLRKVRYKKHKIEKQLYEEQQNRINKKRKYIQALQKENFPIDAEMLVNNFFKAARKDPDGAAKILENNPATYAPIQVDKIPARFFGIIKPKPEDGYKINKKIGKFMKDLKA
jgi:hypothetical protein